MIDSFHENKIIRKIQKKIRKKLNIENLVALEAFV